MVFTFCFSWYQLDLKWNGVWLGRLNKCLLWILLMSETLAISGIQIQLILLWTNSWEKQIDIAHKSHKISALAAASWLKDRFRTTFNTTHHAAGGSNEMYWHLKTEPFLLYTIQTQKSISTIYHVWFTVGLTRAHVKMWVKECPRPLKIWLIKRQNTRAYNPYQ